MDQLLPWNDLVNLISAYYPECSHQRGMQQLQTLLRTHFIKQWFHISNTEIEDAFLDIPLYRHFVQGLDKTPLPDKSSIARFHQRLEKFQLMDHINHQVKDQLKKQGLYLSIGHMINPVLSPTAEPVQSQAGYPDNVVVIPPRRLQRANVLNASVAAFEYTHSPDSFSIETSQQPNARIAVRIADDEMSAYIQMQAAHGSNHLTYNDVIQALHNAGVIAGVDNAAINLLLRNGFAEDVRVATGTAPVQGADSAFEMLTSAHQQYSQKPNLLSDSIAFAAERGITIVQKDQALVRRLPATLGIDGQTVTGKTLRAQAGQELDFAQGLSGTRISETDPHLLLANTEGKPTQVPHGMQVEPVLRLAEVNLATGDIDFVGSILVDGNITGKVKLQATADIIVAGLVERASLHAGNDILIKGGVSLDAQLQAGGSVCARFARSSTIQSGTSIEIDEMAMQCYLTAQENILVGLHNPQRGSLVGGVARAMKSIKVPFLGYDEAGITRVIVGVNEELENQYRSLQFAIEDNQSNVEGHLKILHILNKIGDPRNIIGKVNASIQDVELKIKELENKSLIIDEKLNQLRKSKVEVLQEASDTVEVTVANHKVRLTKKYGRGFFGLSDENRLVHIYPKGSGLAN